MESILEKQEQQLLQRFEHYAQTLLPIIRLEGGQIYKRSWTFDPIMTCLKTSMLCRVTAVVKYPHILRNIGPEILNAELSQEAFENLVSITTKNDIEEAAKYAKYLSTNSYLLADICNIAIKERINLYPLMDIMYFRKKEFYEEFKSYEKLGPTHVGVKCMIMFFAKQVASAHTPSKDRQEFLTWVDLLEKQLQHYTTDVGYLQKAYSELKTKDGAMAYLLKDVIMKYVPNILEPINIARGIFYY